MSGANGKSEAAKGGVSPMIPLSIPNLGGREAEYLAECVDTGWVSSAGPFVNRFEKELSERFDVAYVAAVSSGTAALAPSASGASVPAADTAAAVPARCRMWSTSKLSPMTNM